MSIKFGRRKSRGLNFDVNIVPIIDCLVILLTFMLASGAFVSIGILEVKVSGAEDDVVASSTPQVELMVELHPKKQILFRVSGKKSYKKRFKPIEGSWNYIALSDELKKAKNQFPKVTSVTIEAHRNIAYADLVRAMDATKKTHPGALLGGF